MNDKVSEKIISIFNRYEYAFSGSILIADRDEVAFTAASGFANRDFQILNKTDTRFDTASVTKTFTAVATLQLIEMGEIDFDTRITGLIDLSGTKIPSDVTIRHLLSHTSGIADDADEEAGEDYAALFIDKPNYSIRNCSDFLPQFAYKEPLFKAGTNVRYNNCAFILLGLAIEKITGVGYRDYVSDKIFRKCGMERTCFQAKDEICPDTAEGYIQINDETGNFIKWRKNIYAYPPIGTADSGAYTTVADLHCFWNAIHDDVLLTRDYSRMLERPQSVYMKPHKCGSLRFGFAFEFIEADNKTFCIYKDGINSGVAAIMSYYPQSGIHVNILSNQDGNLWEMNRDIRQTIKAATYVY